MDTICIHLGQYINLGWAAFQGAPLNDMENQNINDGAWNCASGDL